MKHLTTILFSFTLVVILFWSCIEKYTPESTESEDLLVIDASVIKGDSVQYVHVSRTTPIGDTYFKAVENCIVRFEDDRGNVYVLEEVKAGVYGVVISETDLAIGAQFKLVVLLPDGTEYHSDWETILESSPVDSVYYAREDYQSSSEKYSDGLQFYTDLKAPEGNTVHYRWRISETFKYSANFEMYGYYYFDFDSLLIFEPPEDSLRYCWISQSVNGLYSSSTANLAINEKKRIPLNYIEAQNYRLSDDYSLLVTQYALTDAAYEYWEQNRVQATESGGLYQTQPSQSVTNIFNVNDQNEKVLGFFWASSYSQKRIYFRGPLLNYRYRYDCKLSDTLVISDLYNLDYSTFYTLLYMDDALNPFYSVAPETCFDCTLQGGKITKPSFWPY